MLIVGRYGTFALMAPSFGSEDVNCVQVSVLIFIRIRGTPNYSLAAIFGQYMAL